MAGTVYPPGAVFPPFWVGSEGDIYRGGNSFPGPAFFGTGTVFGDYCQFLGIVTGKIIFGHGNVFGEHCTFANVLWGSHNVIGNWRVSLGGNSSIPFSNNLFGGEDMFTLKRAHIEQTGMPSSVPLIVCDAAIVENPHGFQVDRNKACPTKQYSTYEGSQGDAGSPASIERTP